MEFFVYIIYSEGLGKYYTGYSHDIDQRLKSHNSGQNKYTRKGIPWEIIYKSSPLSKTEAIKLERKVKKRGASRYLEDID